MYKNTTLHLKYTRSSFWEKYSRHTPLKNNAGIREISLSSLHTRETRQTPNTPRVKFQGMLQYFQTRALIFEYFYSLHNRFVFGSIGLRKGYYTPKHVTNKFVPVYVFLLFVGSTSISNIRRHGGHELKRATRTCNELESATPKL